MIRSSPPFRYVFGRIAPQTDNRAEALVQMRALRASALSRLAQRRPLHEVQRRNAVMRPDGDFPSGELSLLTWSLHGSNIGQRNKLEIRARRVSSANGRVKRLLLADCQRAPEN